MLRLFSWALLIAFAGSAAVAQRAALSSVHGGAGPIHSAIASRNALRDRIHPQGLGRSAPLAGRHHHRHGFFPGIFPEFLPSFETDWTEPGETQAEQSPLIQAQEQFREREAEPPLPPQTIEIPNATPAHWKPLPSTVFILNNGETLETQRYVLTASSLSLTLHRDQRTIPLQMVDMDATLAANRNRGIDLQIPSDNNEVWLRF